MRALATALMSFAVMGVVTSPVWADVTLPSLFTDHAVLQRSAGVPVWGKAEAGEAVTVSIAGREEKTVAGADGKWQVIFKDLPASGEASAPAAGFDLTIRGKNTVVVKDVLVGEVWLCSGQSNMDFRISKANRSWCGLTNEAEEIANAKYPGIRMYIAEPTMRDEPQGDVKGKWYVCSPENAGEFSAVAYFFGRDLHKSLNVPVGLVVSSFGASTAQAWISPKALSEVPLLSGMSGAYQAAREAWVTGNATKAFEDDLKAWEALAAQAKSEGKPEPRKPRAPRDPGQDQHNPSVLYHGMVYPLAPYAIKGVIWYQGESNGYNHALYLDLMKTLIADWRNVWVEKGGQAGEFPFISVQLAAYKPVSKEPVQGNSQIAAVREAQLRSLAVRNTGLVTAVDIGSANNVHPKNKLDVGTRLANVAKVLAYGQEVPYSGPIVDVVSVGEGVVKVKFKHVEGGLVAKGEKLTGFAVEDEGGKWVVGEARIEGVDTVVISAAGVSSPKAVRYAWADNPLVSLFNGVGLPAFPFKTDAETEKQPAPVK